jgi:hypothetical protein
MARYKRGETPKLNEITIKKIAEAIRSGVTIEKATSDCGISKDTLYRWLDGRDGRYSTPLIIEFNRKVESAMEEARLKNLGLFRTPDLTF